VNTSISAPLGHIPVYVRGGSILPLQEPGYTTTESRKNPWGLIVALSEDGDASGDLYIDDGESIEPSETKFISLKAWDGQLKADVSGSYKDENVMGNVTILGIDGCSDSISLNGESVSGATCDEDKGVLKFILKDVTNGGAWQGSWTLKWE
jgi:alpha-glucosidase